MRGKLQANTVFVQLLRFFIAEDRRNRHEIAGTNSRCRLADHFFAIPSLENCWTATLVIFSSFNQYQITGFREFLESLMQNTTGELIWHTVANVIQGFIAGMMAISLVKKIMGADILKKAAPISAGGLIALFFHFHYR